MLVLRILVLLGLLAFIASECICDYAAAKEICDSESDKNTCEFGVMLVTPTLAVNATSMVGAGGFGETLGAIVVATVLAVLVLVCLGICLCLWLKRKAMSEKPPVPRVYELQQLPRPLRPRRLPPPPPQIPDGAGSGLLSLPQRPQADYPNFVPPAQVEHIYEATQ